MPDLKENFDKVTNYANDTMNYLMQSEQNYIIIAFVIVFFILFSLMSWIYSKLMIPNKACNNLDNIYGDSDKFKTNTFMQSDIIAIKKNSKDIIDVYNLNLQDENQKYSIPKNFTIKTAYNCCCIDGYKNNFVDECALEYCIKNGARCLDFEIYSLNNKPIVAASTANNNNIKETYNFIKFDEILRIIARDAFNEDVTGCHRDPLYLHFRIMSENKEIFDKMGEFIKTTFKDTNRLISDKVVHIDKNSDDEKYFLGTSESGIKIFAGKIIIICYCNTPSLIRNSELGNYTNMLSNGSAHFLLLRFKTLEASGTANSLIKQQSKSKFIMVLPDINNEVDNFNWTIPYLNGCQFIGMKFQTFDTFLISYLNLFIKYGKFSFIPKHKNLSLALNPDTEYDVRVELNNMPDNILSNPPGFYTISGDKIDKTGDDAIKSYNALMCGNPEQTFQGYKPLAVLSWLADETPVTINDGTYNLDDLKNPTYRKNNFRTCNEIKKRSHQFDNNVHINNTAGDIILK